MGKAKRDYIKGFYRILKNGDKYDLVYTNSIDGDPYGRGLNCDLEIARDCSMNQLKEAVKENKITRAIWYGTGSDSYIMPRDFVSGKVMLLIID